MAKRPVRTVQGSDRQDIPVVGMREPCPCGSGRRYKACHGRDAARQGEARIQRPFAGLASECDLVALRELVPAATTSIDVNLPQARDRSITIATVLPMAWPGLVRDTGEIFVAMQVNTGSGDPSRDLADAVIRALELEPGSPVPPRGLPGEGPRLQDIINPATSLVIQVRDDFEFWIDGDPTDDVKRSLERVSRNVFPTVRLDSVEAAYWTRIGEKEHLRWVMAHDEEALLTALARLHASGQDTLGEGTRFVGMFRSCGLLVPVWDLPFDFGAEAAAVQAPAMWNRINEALLDTSPLTNEARRARSGLQTRQVTLR